MSVSEKLKQKNDGIRTEKNVLIWKKKPEKLCLMRLMLIPLLPKFLQEEAELTGASRGSAYHKLLELLDFSKRYDEAALKEFIGEQKRSGKLSEEMCASIREKDIFTLF